MSTVKPALSPTTPTTLKVDTGISLGLGLTNECNLKCAFCYRDPTRADRLSFEQVKSVMERLPVRSVNLGTGENGMHPDYKHIGLPANAAGEAHNHFQRSQYCRSGRP